MSVFNRGAAVAANYNSSPYAYLTCPQLAQYKTMLNGRLATASSEQETARTEDIIGNVTIGLPIGSASHKWTPWQISDLKGRVAAVERVETTDSCAGQRQASAANPL